MVIFILQWFAAPGVAGSGFFVEIPRIFYLQSAKNAVK